VINAVVATATKAKIDVVLAVVYMLTQVEIFFIQSWFNLIITKFVAILSIIFDR
jgi:hypothetical protein